MAQLEARLIIGARDETGGAFKSLKDQIAGLDRQISTFDKLAAATGKIGKAADPMINSINKSTQALEAQKASVTALSEKLAASAGSADEAAVGQRALGEATEATTRLMVAQGAKAAEIAGQLVRAQQTAARGARRAREESGLGGRAAEGAAVVGGSVGGIAGLMIGGEAIHAGIEALKAGATLEQMKVRVEALAPDNPQQAQFAEKLAQEVSAKYPVITQEKALDTFVEMYANSTSLDKNGKSTLDEAKARRNMMVASQLQVAGAALDIPVEPHDVQNLIKAMEGTGQADDPNAVKKITDLYFRSKQVFGSALNSDMIRDLVANAKAANFSLSDKSFAESVIMTTEGNASRVGNEIAQTVNTLVGGHMQKQTARWLINMGLATGFKTQGSDKVTLTGITESDLLETDRQDWANKVLLPHILKHAPHVAEKDVEARMKMLRDAALKLDPNAQVDERSLHERAESALIATQIQKMGVRTTVANQLSHLIANQHLIERDLAAVQNTSSPEQAAALIKENPVAAFTEFTNAFENLGAVVVSPAVKAIAPLLDELARAMAQLSVSAERFQKAHPDLAVAGVVGGGVVGGLGAGAAFIGGLKWIGRLLGLGGGAGAGAGPATAAPAAEGWLPYLARTLGIPALGAGTAGSLIAGDISGNAALQAKLKKDHPDWTDAQMRQWAAQQASALSPPIPPKPVMGPFLPVASRVPTPWLNQAQDMEMAMRAEQAFRKDPEAARGNAYHQLGGANVSFTGRADVQQTLHLDVTLDPGLKAKLDAMPDFTYAVPLAPLGVMDDDAAPGRAPGTGHM